MTVQRVLSVDDEEFNLEIIEEILDDQGFELKMVDSGPACLAVVGSLSRILFCLMSACQI